MGEIFDRIFDFNGDGETDDSEELLAFLMMLELLDEEDDPE